MFDEQSLIERVDSLTQPLVPRPTDTPARLESVPDIRAVLFDVYGTLVISASGDIGLSADAARSDAFLDAWGAAGMDSALLPPGFDGPARLKEMILADHERVRARGIDHPEVDILELWQQLVSEVSGGDTEPTSDAQLRRLALEYELRTNPVWPMPDLAKTLDALSHRGLVLGIVSNAQFYTPLMLAAFLGRSVEEAGFDPRCCSWSYRQRVAKPSTAVYRPALEGLGTYHDIVPEEVLYVGNDMRNDVWPAQRHGCKTVLFAGDARSLRLRSDDANLVGVAADRVVHTLPQIINLL
jgi:putative hydrolase of the HAD superfamily